MLASGHDALLVVSFGGPERPDEVMPFLERVTRGRNVPPARLLEVAKHYDHFGGKSPIHDRTRELIEALEGALGERVYWGNRFAPPFLADTITELRDAGVERALAFVTSALPSYSGCRAYLDELERARASVAGAPIIDKLRPFHDHPGYVETCAARLRDVMVEGAHVIFTAHSVPVAMDHAYSAALSALASQVAAAAHVASFSIAYQSRSGPPHVPWLEPDILEALRGRRGTIVIAPIGFVADHMEVVWDLDVEARARAEELGLGLVRAGTANAHPRFVRMILEQVEARAFAPCRPDCCRVA